MPCQGDSQHSLIRLRSRCLIISGKKAVAGCEKQMEKSKKGKQALITLAGVIIIPILGGLFFDSIRTREKNPATVNFRATKNEAERALPITLRTEGSKNFLADNDRRLSTKQPIIRGQFAPPLDHSHPARHRRGWSLSAKKFFEPSVRSVIGNARSASFFVALKLDRGRVLFSRSNTVKK